MTRVGWRRPSGELGLLSLPSGNETTSLPLHSVSRNIGFLYIIQYPEKSPKKLHLEIIIQIYYNPQEDREKKT